MKRLFLPLCFTLLLAPACATMGHQIDPAQVEAVTVGVTTKEQALKMLGTPTATSVTTNGMTTMIWSYAHAVVFAGAKSSSVYLSFGADGVLTNKTVSGTNM